MTNEMAYDYIASTLYVSKDWAKKTVLNWKKKGEFNASKRGKHSKKPSPMDDEVFRAALDNFVDSNSMRKGQKHLTLNMK